MGHIRENNPAPGHHLVVEIPGFGCRVCSEGGWVSYLQQKVSLLLHMDEVGRRRVLGLQSQPLLAVAGLGEDGQRHRTFGRLRFNQRLAVKGL